MKKTGFSLVELSIVLVIIGFIVGGVLVGQDLIQAAKTRSVITEVDNYKTAVSSFRDKYIAIPGDMTNATQFWEEMTTVVPPAQYAMGQKHVMVMAAGHLM